MSTIRNIAIIGTSACILGVLLLMISGFTSSLAAAEPTPEYKLREREVRALEHIAVYMEATADQLASVCFELPICKGPNLHPVEHK